MVIKEFDVDEKVKDAFFKSGLWLWNKHPEKTKWLFTYLSGLFLQFDKNEAHVSVTIYFQDGKPERIEEKPVKRINEPQFIKNVLSMAERIKI